MRELSTLKSTGTSNPASHLCFWVLQPYGLDCCLRDQRLVCLASDGTVTCHQRKPAQSTVVGSGYEMALLLGVLQEPGCILGGWVLLGVVQPASHVVLHPVGTMAVAQEKVPWFATS